MRENDVLLYLSLKHHGEFQEILKELRTIRHVEQDVIEDFYDTADCSFITLIDKTRYPESLRRCTCPPIVLYYYGNIGLIKEFKRTYAYVGSRDASEYGLQIARKIGEDCAKKGLIVVSGLARGIDGAVMEGALDAGGKVIAVLGTGINKPYPNINKDIYERVKNNGLVLSEYPPNIEVDKTSFPKRNRIIAALGRVVIVGESAIKSGTMTTVKHALEQGREIGAIPHEASIANGCNALIKEGAALIEDADDVQDLIDISVMIDE